MIKKFAAIKLMNDISEIPVKYGISDKTPAFLMEWYIKSFNPYLIEEAEQFGERCLLVRLPVTKAQAERKPHKVFDILKRTITDVCDYSAGIAVLDDDIPSFSLSMQQEMPVRIANGNGLFPFFILDSIYKALSAFGKDIRKTEILIIPGDRDLTMCILDVLSPYINLLSVMPVAMPDGNTDEYFIKARRPLINPVIITPASADIIINLSENASFDNDYQRRAIYFDLSGNNERLRELLRIRGDMMIINGLRLKAGAYLVNHKYFEAIFFAKSRNYRQLLNHGYNYDLMRAVAAELKCMRINLSAFFCQGLLLSTRPEQSYSLIDKQYALGYNFQN